MSISSSSIGADVSSNLYTSRLEIRAYSDNQRKNRIYGKGFVAPINPASIKIAYSNTLSGEVGLGANGANLSLNNNDAEVISFKLILSDSSVFHYMGRNTLTLLNNYEVDNISNIGYAMGIPLDIVNKLSTLDGQFEQGNDFGGQDVRRFKKEMAPLSLSDTSSFSAGDNPKRYLPLGIPVTNRDGHVTSAVERFLNLTTQNTLTQGANKGQAAYLALVWGRVFSSPGYHDNAQSLIFGKLATKYRRQRIYPCFLKSVDVNYTHFTKDGRALRAELDCTFIEDTAEE